MRLFSLLLLFFSLSLVHGQILTPATWTTSTSTTSVKAGEEMEIVFSVRIEPSWYLYSTEFPCEDGPLKTAFTFEPHPSYELAGNVVAVNPVDKHDKIFDCDVRIFKGKAEFRQKIRVKKSPLVLKGIYEYQVCTETTGQCVPGDGEFEVKNIQVTGTATAVKSEQPVDSPATEQQETARGYSPSKRASEN